MENITFNKQALIERAINKINEHTGLTFLSPGSKVRMLVEALGEEVGTTAEVFDIILGSNFIRNASGKTLDYIGEIYGLEREKEQKVEISSQEENVYFYTLAEGFGDINGGQDIVINPGTVEFYNTDYNSPDRIVYVNTEKIILKKDSNQHFISVKSKYAGEEYNLGARALNFHNFTGYAQGLDRTLFVTNEESIIYGRNKESDQNFRFRIQQEKISGEAGNYSSVRMAALSVPGVSDVKTIRYSKGIGTSEWLIKATTPIASKKLISSVQSALAKKQSEGILCFASAPKIVGVEMSFSLTYRRALEDTQKNAIKSDVRKQIQDYINNLDIGAPLIIDQITRIVLSSSQEILSMGEQDSRDNYRYIYVYKRATNDSSPARSSLVRDYSSKQDERIILEPTIEIPIKIFDNN